MSAFTFRGWCRQPLHLKKRMECTSLISLVAVLSTFFIVIQPQSINWILWKNHGLEYHPAHQINFTVLGPQAFEQFMFPVKKITIRWSPITTICPFTFARLISLIQLDLRDNRIQQLLSYTFQNLTNLKSLLLERNCIHHVQNNALSGLLQLHCLYIQVNSIKRITPYIFMPLKKLLSLNMAENRQENLTSNNFSPLRSVSKLIFDSNKIRTINSTAFANLTKLQYLYLLNNPIHMTSSILQDQGNLHSFYMSGARHLELRDDMFSGKKKLIILRILSSYIPSISSRIFMDMINLIHLDLSDNQLRNISSRFIVSMRRIQTVCLSKNKLEYLPSYAFSTSSKRFQVILSYNEITCLSRQAFAGAPGLYQLDISHNKLRHILEQPVVDAAQVSMKSITMMPCKQKCMQNILRKPPHGFRCTSTMFLFMRLQVPACMVQQGPRKALSLRLPSKFPIKDALWLMVIFLF